MAYIFAFLCSAVLYYCIYSKSSTTECSGFHPWFHKRAISFSFKLMKLIAVCQFCKLDRCALLKEKIKGKAGGPESFGCDRVESSQRTVMTSIAARAQQETASEPGMVNQGPGRITVLVMTSARDHQPPGSERGPRAVPVRRPTDKPPQTQ